MHILSRTAVAIGLVGSLGTTSAWASQGIMCAAARAERAVSAVDVEDARAGLHTCQRRRERTLTKCRTEVSQIGAAIGRSIASMADERAFCVKTTQIAALGARTLAARP
jgi:hypothetical protein